MHSDVHEQSISVRFYVFVVARWFPPGRSKAEVRGVVALLWKTATLELVGEKMHRSAARNIGLDSHNNAGPWC